MDFEAGHHRAHGVLDVECDDIGGRRKRFVCLQNTVTIKLDTHRFVAGIMGVALATPLAAATMVVVRMVYVEDELGDVQPKWGGPAARYSTMILGACRREAPPPTFVQT